MESYIPISYLNDFIFCPRSIYFHQLYGEMSTRLYQARPQIEGRAVHGAIDESRYSTRASVLQGIEIYSDKYGLCGKLDQFDTRSGILTERKKKIKIIYDGYRLQLYAQYFALSEAGYSVKELRLYSFDDNKIYIVPLPSEDEHMLSVFETTVDSLHSLNLNDFFQDNPEKCRNCIYSPLCDQALC